MIKTLIIIFVCFALIKFLFMLVVLAFKIKYIKQPEEKQLCIIRKETSLEWGNLYDKWHIIPTCSITINEDFSITFEWLKIYYAHVWKAIDYETIDKEVEATRK